MNNLEKALLGDNYELSEYIMTHGTENIRRDIEEIKQNAATQLQKSFLSKVCEMLSNFHTSG